MSVTLPDHTDTDSSMMFMAAKPATARQRSRRRASAASSLLGAHRLERMARDSRCRPARAMTCGRIEARRRARSTCEPAIGEVQPRIGRRPAALRARARCWPMQAAQVMPSTARSICASAAVASGLTKSERSSALGHGSAPHRRHDAAARAEHARRRRAYRSTISVPLARLPRRRCRRKRPAPRSLSAIAWSSRASAGCASRALRVEAVQRRALGVARVDLERRRRRRRRANACRRPANAARPAPRPAAISCLNVEARPCRSSSVSTPPKVDIAACTMHRIDGERPRRKSRRSRSAPCRAGQFAWRREALRHRVALLAHGPKK